MPGHSRAPVAGTGLHRLLVVALPAQVLCRHALRVAVVALDFLERREALPAQGVVRTRMPRHRVGDAPAVHRVVPEHERAVAGLSGRERADAVSRRALRAELRERAAHAAHAVAQFLRVPAVLPRRVVHRTVHARAETIEETVGAAPADAVVTFRRHVREIVDPPEILDRKRSVLAEAEHLAPRAHVVIPGVVVQRPVLRPLTVALHHQDKLLLRPVDAVVKRQRRRDVAPDLGRDEVVLVVPDEKVKRLERLRRALVLLLDALPRLDAPGAGARELLHPILVAEELLQERGTTLVLRDLLDRLLAHAGADIILHNRRIALRLLGETACCHAEHRYEQKKSFHLSSIIAYFQSHLHLVGEAPPQHKPAPTSSASPPP